MVVCDESHVSTHCSMAQGPYTVRLVASGKGGDKKQLFCLDVDFDVVPQGMQQAQAEEQQVVAK